MDKVRGRIILILLCIYPFYSFFAVKYLDIDPNYLAGLLAYLLGGQILLSSFAENRNLQIPSYLLALGLFFLYTFFSSVFISDRVYDTGLIKYLYHDPYLRSIAFLFVIENTVFEKKAIAISLNFLFGVLMLAALVSLRQVYEPLFFANVGSAAGGEVSLQRYQLYLESLGGNQVELLTPIKEGYRYSIYSWISGISVGMDSLAIFSILLGLNNTGKIKSFLLICSSGFISFLSSSRWIMLNFVSILSQKVIGRSSPILYSLKLLASLAVVVLLVTQGASYFGVDLNKMVQERLLSESANTRIYAFEVFDKVYPAKPIFGTGGVDTERMTMLIQGKTSQIHVGWLKLLYYHGLVGGLIFLSFIIILLLYLYRLAKANNYWGSFFAILAFVLANFTLVEFSIFYHGLLLAILMAKYLKNEDDITDDDIELTREKPVRHQELLVAQDF